MDQIVRRTPFLSCSVGVSTLLYLHFIYSPGPSRLSSQHVPDHSNVLVQQQKDGEKCDMYKGHWVRDFNGSLYTNFNCTTIPKSKNCFKNGRRDRDFLNWRWKPDRCELPRFNPKTFFQIVKGKKMAFIGDSVAQNHMHSLFCLLSKEETPVPLLEPNDSKNRIIDFNDSVTSSQTWHFPSHDFTVMGLRSNFLVKAEERSAIHGSDSFMYNLNLDKVDDIWAQKLPSLDYAIFSGGHWFFRPNFLYQGGNLLGCVYCSDPNVTDLALGFSLRMSYRAVLNYINECKDCKEGIVTIIRTFAPSLFENGFWNDGGSCNRTRPLPELDISWGSRFLELRSFQMEEIERFRRYVTRKKGGKKRIEVMDVTRATQMRPDGHPGLYLNWTKGYNDCLHWCLPGPIDAWNDFLLAILKKEML